MSAFRLFQSCSATVSRPAFRRAALARSTVRPHASRLRFAPTRPFSATTDSSSSQTTPPADSTQSTKEDECAAKLKVKDEEIKELTNRLRYSQADFINLQRMSSIEKDQARDYAITRFAKDMVTTVDTLQMALSSKSSPNGPPAPSAEDPLRVGIELTQKQLLSTLERYGVTQFNPAGEKFDPHWHEAMFEAIVPGKEEGTVIEVLKVGYKIKDRCLRAAQVGISGSS